MTQIPEKDRDVGSWGHDSHTLTPRSYPLSASYPFSPCTKPVTVKVSGWLSQEVIEASVCPSHPRACSYCSRFSEGPLIASLDEPTGEKARPLPQAGTWRWVGVEGFRVDGYLRPARPDGPETSLRGCEVAV